jgi:hypothetical protein
MYPNNYKGRRALHLFIRNKQQLNSKHRITMKERNISTIRLSHDDEYPPFLRGI